MTLGKLFLDEGRLDDAHAHAERAKSHAVDSAHSLGTAVILQASTWYQQHSFEEAMPEDLRAAEVYEKLGAERNLVDSSSSR